LKDDCHDDPIDSNSFTKNDTELLFKYLTKFLDLILGALTAAPRILEPEIKIPLNKSLVTMQPQQQMRQEPEQYLSKPKCMEKWHKIVHPKFKELLLTFIK